MSTCKGKYSCARIQPRDVYLQHGNIASNPAEHAELTIFTAGGHALVHGPCPVCAILSAACGGSWLGAALQHVANAVPRAIRLSLLMQQHLAGCSLAAVSTCHASHCTPQSAHATAAGSVQRGSMQRTMLLLLHRTVRLCSSIWMSAASLQPSWCTHWCAETTAAGSVWPLQTLTHLGLLVQRVNHQSAVCHVGQSLEAGGVIAASCLCQ